MAEIISLVNQKGGVGKTTSSVNLAAALSLKGYKTLVIDMDPQANASRALGFSGAGAAIYEALCGKLPIKETIQKTAAQNLFLIPSAARLAGLEAELYRQSSWESFLKNKIKGLPPDFDCIFIDSPPSLGLLTVNVLTASRRLIAPLQCEYYALEGFSRLIETIRRAKQSLNPGLELTGILLTMFDSRNSLSKQIAEEVRRHFGDKVFKSLAPRNVRLSEAPGFGKSIFQYDPRSQGAKSYYELSAEFEDRMALRPKGIRKEPKPYDLNPALESALGL